MKERAPSCSSGNDVGARVVIVDLGDPPEWAATEEEPLPARRPQRVSPRTRSVALGAVLVTLLGIAGDTHRSAESPAAGGDRPDTCAALAVQQERAAGDEPSDQDILSGFSADDFDVPGILGSAAGSSKVAMTVYQMDPRTGRGILLAFVDSDELWEFCITPTELESLGVAPYPGEAELGELPEGAAYVYREDPITLEYRVAGIRLHDGVIVDVLTLRDGRTLPLVP